MHAEAMNYLQRIRSRVPAAGKRFLEIGSLDVNGSARHLFEAAFWWGIDIRPGRGVDEVVDAVDYDGKGQFDVVVTTETLEHCPEPATIIDCAWRALIPGGILVITAAAPPRDPHNCDGSAWGGVEFYHNIDEAALQELLTNWVDVDIEYDPVHGDIYACARKPEPTSRKKATRD